MPELDEPPPCGPGEVRRDFCGVHVHHLCSGLHRVNRVRFDAVNIDSKLPCFTRVNLEPSHFAAVVSWEGLFFEVIAPRFSLRPCAHEIEWPGNPGLIPRGA